MVTYSVSALVERWIGGGENVQLAIAGVIFVLLAMIWQIS